MISRWPARGGPVILENTVYYAAGIWPSDGIYLYALDTQDGRVIWSNDHTGDLYMPQPHGGADAKSGVAPQGYLLANSTQLVVPTGRAVPAVFNRSTGELKYYHLQKNHSIGSARAMMADQFLFNGGCLFDQQTGLISARCGRGLLTATRDGIIQSVHSAMVEYRWKDMQAPNGKNKPSTYRGLERISEITLDPDWQEPKAMTALFQQFPNLKKDLYNMMIRFKDVSGDVLKQSNLEVMLQQRRPEIQAFGLQTEPFLSATYEKSGEVIVAGDDAICGTADRVRVVDLAAQKVRWSYPVKGTALGLAVSRGKLIVSTDQGMMYCFGKEKTKTVARKEADADVNEAAQNTLVDYKKAAKEILGKGITTGLCVDLGSGTGDLALALANRSKLQICAIEPDGDKAALARRKLDIAGLYGIRVAVHHADPGHPSYPEYCANLVISSRALTTGEPDSSVMKSIQRPSGGMICIGQPGHMRTETREPLEGEGSWTHLNANPANTLCSPDRLVKGPLEMLWFRDVDFEITDRHAQGPAPLANRGCLVVEGLDGFCALDAYNGHTLWTYPLKGILKDCNGVHHDVAVGDTGNNFCLSDDSVYVATGSHCLRIDLFTGKKLDRFTAPAEGTNKNWGYLSYCNSILYGSILNDEHTVSPRYRNIRMRTESVQFFAMDAGTGKLKWSYTPKDSIRNNAITIGNGRVYLIDRPLAMADRITNPSPNGKHRARLKPGEHPGGSLMAFDAITGKALWQQPEDIFGTQLAISEKYNILLMFYQAARFDFGHILPSEIGGRMAAFDARTGQRIWDRKVSHKSRPLINDDMIYAYGGAWNLKTGEEIPFKLDRTHGCGQIAGSTYLMLFRSATLGYLDLIRNAGIENYGGIRPGCWINAIPSAGLALVPDGSSKCLCSYQMHAWLALKERE